MSEYLNAASINRRRETPLSPFQWRGLKEFYRLEIFRKYFLKEYLKEYLKELLISLFKRIYLKNIF